VVVYMTKFKIIHERPQCIACGACVAAAPEYWEMNEDDGLADLKKCTVNGENEERIIDESEVEPNKEAVECCPVQIISIKKID